MKVELALAIFTLMVATSAQAFVFRDPCLNPEDSWRIKRNLDIDWWKAKQGFRRVMTSPFNDKFPTLIVKGLQEYVPDTMHNYWFTFAEEENGISVLENVTDYRVYGSRCARATAIMTYDDPTLGFMKQDVEWFSGIDKDDKGNVSYYFGFSKCEIEGPWPTEVTNLMCNELDLGMFIMTNQKRWGCVIENWERDDVLDFCGDQFAILMLPPASARAEILSKFA